MVASGKSSQVTGSQGQIGDLFFMYSLLFIWVLSHAYVFHSEKLINNSLKYP